MSSGTRLLLIGPPGAGKGTQAVELSSAFGVPAISTGDIFRHNVKNETELGLKAKAFMDAGDNVPDSLTNDLITDRLENPDCAGGFLLDGYPDVVVERLRLRAIDQGRSDDDESVVRHRLDVYQEQTAPLIDIFTARGAVVAIDGIGGITEVTGRIMAALAERGITAA